jgi:hypothetical protein
MTGGVPRRLEIERFGKLHVNIGEPLPQSMMLPK